MESQQKSSPQQSSLQPQGYDATAQSLNAAAELHRAGRLVEAEKIYRQILVTQPGNPYALHLLGVVYGQTGNPQRAVDLISRAIAIQGDNAAFHGNLGEFLRHLGRMEESLASFRTALRLRADDPVLHNNFGVSLATSGQTEAAIVEFQRAVEIYPDYADAHSNLAAALNAAGRTADAVSAGQTAIRLSPQMASAFNNLGNALVSAGRFSEAIDVFERVAAFDPNDPRVHTNLGMVYLILGDFSRGWKEYEWRLKVSGLLTARHFTQPRWTGGELSRKTILLYPEQGFGDTIQMARFIPRVAELGAKVIVELPAELLGLFKNFPCVKEFTRRERPQGEGPQPAFDVQCPFMSLGLALGLTAQNISANVPYLHADPALAQQWRSRFDATDNRVRVGLVWGGRPQHVNERNRSMKLEQLGPLSAATNAAFFSLQKGEAAAQIAAPPPGLQITDWTSDLRDFADTAALIDNLDIVITVDTSVAHLAGAMGKPVWILLPWVPDWRWMLDRTDTPWYPTARLFRQKSPGDWAEVVNRVAEEIQKQTRP